MARTALNVSRDHARTKLSKRVAIGEDLLQRLHAAAFTTDDLLFICDERNIWSRKNIGIFRHLVSDDSLWTELAPLEELAFYPGEDDLDECRARCEYLVSKEIDIVEGVLERLDLMSEPALPLEVLDRPFSLDVFISHSSRDEAVALSLINLIRQALDVPSSAIRCTSVDGYRLRAGDDTDARIRAEVLEARVFIGLITLDSIKSPYVLFELGARWGIDLPLVPLLAAGAKPRDLGGPLAGINALDSGSEAQVLQLVTDIARYLDRKAGEPAAYLTFVKALVNLSTIPRDTELACTDLIGAEGDAIILLADYLNGRMRAMGFDVGPIAVRFADVDSELRLAPGTTRVHIATAAEVCGLIVKRKAEASTLLDIAPQRFEYS